MSAAVDWNDPITRQFLTGSVARPKPGDTAARAFYLLDSTVPVLVREDQAGYREMRGDTDAGTWDWGPTMDDAWRICDLVNRELFGIDREEAVRIVGESMLLQVDADASAVHQWFSLSYANYLVLPRTLLQSMPGEWQARLVRCLRELGEAFPDVELPDYEVTAGRIEEVGDLDDDELHAAGIVRDPDGTHYNRRGDEIEPEHRVLVPGTDPIPHYDRGRAYIEPAPTTGKADA